MSEGGKSKRIYSVLFWIIAFGVLTASRWVYVFLGGSVKSFDHFVLWIGGTIIALGIGFSVLRILEYLKEEIVESTKKEIQEARTEILEKLEEHERLLHDIRSEIKLSR